MRMGHTEMELAKSCRFKTKRVWMVLLNHGHLALSWFACCRSTWFPVITALTEFETAMRYGGQPRLPAVSVNHKGQYIVSVFPSG